jgi:cellulose synthase/poly-beta-1,6-N-acetylglucosamine synthase-like glycosyltransferase
MTPRLTVVVPIRHEDGLLEERLRRILRAARGVQGRLLLAPDVTVPEGLAAARRFASTAPDVEVHVGRKRGKFPAVRDALARVADGVLVLVDADVIVGSGALCALTEPLRSGTADVCAGRVYVAKPMHDGGFQARTIRAWEDLNCQAWHILRATHRSSAWSLPGQLYATRASMFPSQVPVATVDDGCVGLHLRAAGAVFAYVPSAAAWHAVPRGYVGWVRQKFRYRRGWATLRRLYPGEVDDLERNLRVSLHAAAGGRRLVRGLLTVHFEAMRLTARIADVVAPVRRSHWRQVR